MHIQERCVDIPGIPVVGSCGDKRTQQLSVNPRWIPITFSGGHIGFMIETSTLHIKHHAR